MSFSQVALFLGLATVAFAFPQNNPAAAQLPISQGLLNNLASSGKTMGNAAAKASGNLLQAPAILLKGAAKVATATGRVADNLANTASDTATQITNDPANTLSYASSGLLAGVAQIVVEPIRLMIQEMRLRVQEAIVVFVRNLISQIPEPLMQSLLSVIDGVQELLKSYPVVGAHVNEQIDRMKNSGMMNLDENKLAQNNNNN